MLSFLYQSLLSTASIHMSVGPYTGAWVASWWEGCASEETGPPFAAALSFPQLLGWVELPPSPPAYAWILAVLILCRCHPCSHSRFTCAVIQHTISLQTSTTSGSYSLSMSSFPMAPGSWVECDIAVSFRAERLTVSSSLYID